MGWLGEDRHRREHLPRVLENWLSEAALSRPRQPPITLSAKAGQSLGVFYGAHSANFAAVLVLKCRQASSERAFPISLFLLPVQVSIYKAPLHRSRVAAVDDDVIPFAVDFPLAMAPLAVAAPGTDGVAERQVVIEVHEPAVFEGVFQSSQLASGQSPSGRQVVAQRVARVVVVLDDTTDRDREQEQEKHSSLHGRLPLIGSQAVTSARMREVSAERRIKVARIQGDIRHLNISFALAVPSEEIEKS